MIVNDTLTSRIERAIIAERSAFAAGMASVHPESGGTLLPVAGGQAIFTGRGFFSNRAFGVGLDRAVEKGDIDEIERFYTARGLSSQIEIASTSERSLLTLLGQLSYNVVRFHNIYAQQLDAMRSASKLALAVEITSVFDTMTANAWSETLLDGFGYTAVEERQRVQRWNDMLCSLPALTALVATVDGHAAGSASVLVIGDTAVLGGAATKPEFRCRGVQRALIETRLTIAANAGCDLAVVTADPGSSSGRNAERTGFQLVGTHIAMRKRSP